MQIDTNLTLKIKYLYTEIKFYIQILHTKIQM